MARDPKSGRFVREPLAPILFVPADPHQATEWTGAFWSVAALLWIVAIAAWVLK